ncbi:hypothetical protein PV433_09790 [Paenibacillus sp. GYB004]
MNEERRAVGGSACTVLRFVAMAGRLLGCLGCKEELSGYENKQIG